MRAVGTDLVCEGYKLSTNSFAEDALRVTHGDIEIACHRQVAARVSSPDRAGIPAVLRLPKGIALGYQLALWINFKRAVLPVSGRIVAPEFPLTTKDFSAVNTARFPDKFTAPSITAEKLSDVVCGEIARRAKARRSAGLLSYGMPIEEVVAEANPDSEPRRHRGSTPFGSTRRSCSHSSVWREFASNERLSMNSSHVTMKSLGVR